MEYLPKRFIRLVLVWGMSLILIASCSDNSSAVDGRISDQQLAPDRFVFKDSSTMMADGGLKDGAIWLSPRCIKRIIPIEACEKTNGGQEQCDDLDNDCNGLIDDVDQGKDGIFDCDRIALLGESGIHASANFLQWLKSSTNPENVVRIQTQQDHPLLTRELLEEYNVVVLDQLVREYTDAEAEALREWVAGGCGVGAMTGHTGAETAKTYPNSLMAKLGLSYTGSLENGPVTQFLPHLITVGISKPITFYGGFPVAPVANVSGGNNSNIATLPSGNLAGIAQERLNGRVFVWGDEWIEFDSEWNNASFDVPKLWSNTFKWLGHYN
jgi:hypothetical protein